MLEAILFILYGVLALIFALGAWRLQYAFKHFQLTPILKSDHSTHKPSVTVCIPARNEHHAMTECLERVIASDYPKLEIIVLDDLSGDNTPTLIKAYAHQGVRFVEGTSLPEGWLGKNHALQGLIKEASGTYILFMDVDTRIEPDSITQLVDYAIGQEVLMVSVLPQRVDGRRFSVIFSTLRYFWELMFHRASSPATTSNAWMIHRHTLLERWQGFDSFKDAIQPESRFSAALMAEGQYRFVMSNPALGISYEKKWRSQIDTSIRLLFPLLGAQAANGIIAILDLLILASPLFIIIAGFITGFGVHQIIATVFWLLFAGLYASYLRRIWKRGWLLGALAWPLVVLQEAVIIGLSIERYLNKKVTWKGRLVRIPKS